MHQQNCNKLYIILRYDWGIETFRRAPVHRRNHMSTELFLILVVAVLLYGLINSTEKVLSFRQQRKEDSRNLNDYHSRM